MDDANKELYPPVNNTVKNAMQQLCYFPNINFSLGDIQEIKISDIHKECIRLALKKLDKICEDCSGDHDYWTVAGKN